MITDMNDSAPAQTYDPALLSTRGRIGRLRYIAYCTILGLLLFPVVLVLSLLTAYVWEGLAFLMYVAIIPFFVLSFVMARRRLHDLDASGWWIIALFVPLLNFGVGIWMTCFAGKEGINRFGPAPAPNTRTIRIFAWVYFGLIALGLVALVGLAVYQQDLLRAATGGAGIEARY